jgi:hypothetical protein
VTRRRQLLRVLGTALAVLLLALGAACSGDDDEEATTTGEAVAEREGVRPRDEARPLAAAVVLPAPVPIRRWAGDAENVEDVSGQVTLDELPVVGARVQVGDYVLPDATDAEGRFTYPADATLPERHEVTVVDATDARVDGYRLTPEEQDALAEARGAVQVSYTLADVETAAEGSNVRVSGRVAFADGSAPAGVVLTSFQLSGTVRDADGNPVEGAIVSVRTIDRDFWTFSEPSDAEGNYVSVFGASDRIASDPVPMTVRISVGDQGFSFLLFERVTFARLQSASMDVNLPPEGYALALPVTSSYPGAVYEGVLVGAAAADGTMIEPVSATWPDESGAFELVLPASAVEAGASLWAGLIEAFQTDEVTPGSEVDLEGWPAEIPPDVPSNLLEVEAP